MHAWLRPERLCRNRSLGTEPARKPALSALPRGRSDATPPHPGQACRGPPVPPLRQMSGGRRVSTRRIAEGTTRKSRPLASGSNRVDAGYEKFFADCCPSPRRGNGARCGERIARSVAAAGAFDFAAPFPPSSHISRNPPCRPFCRASRAASGRLPAYARRPALHGTGAARLEII